MKLIKVKFKTGGVFLVLTAFINGKDCTMLIDTGANITVFDIYFWRGRHVGHIDLTTQLATTTVHDKIGSYTSKGNIIKIGKRNFVDRFVVISDLKIINEALVAENRHRISGILGTDILYNAVIDFNNGTLKFPKAK